MAGLYLHVPFCSAICPYCDYVVLQAGPERRAAYVRAVSLEVERTSWEGPAFATLYLGGGTPSALEPRQLSDILHQLRTGFCWRDRVRATMEVNPEDVTPLTARQWRALGIDCVSLGVQSFEPAVLRFLGRRHSPRQALAAVRTCQDAGFATVAFDLIYGYPGHKPVTWRRQLEDAAALAPDHLSCYQLTVHHGTRFGRQRARGDLAELPDPVQAELFLTTHRALEQAGFEGYEVSNFARAPEHRSQHNQIYWHHAPYLGLGPSAHSFDGVRRRWWNLRKVRLWQQALERGLAAVDEEETLSDRELALEAVMLGLRTRDGVDVAGVRKRWRIDLAAANGEVVERLVNGGLLIAEEERWRPTLEGMTVADFLARSVRIPSGG